MADEARVTKTPERGKHWGHSLVDTIVGDIEHVAPREPKSATPYLRAFGHGLGQYASVVVLSAGVGTVDAMFGRDVGDAVSAVIAFGGIVGSIALAESPHASQYSLTIGAAHLGGLVRSRTEKFIGGGGSTAPGGHGAAPSGGSAGPSGGSATDHISAVAAKMQQT